jgi:hypothetical protein
MPTHEQLEALAAEWEAKAVEEESGLTPALLENSREGLAASIYRECANDLRYIIRRAAMEAAR